MSGIRGVHSLVLRSLRQHLLSTLITAVGVALAVGLLMTVVTLNNQAYRAFTSGDAGFDAVLGARGSELQIVLANVFHLENPTANLPWSQYVKVRDHPLVRSAVPIGLGDNYNGYRIVGVDGGAIVDHEVEPGRKLLTFAQGGMFDDARKEAVIGSIVAQQTGLKVGSSFHSYHNVGAVPDADDDDHGHDDHDHDDHADHDDHNAHSEHRHDDSFVVTGILGPTNTPFDRVLLVPLEAHFRMEGHAFVQGDRVYQPQPGVPIPDEWKQVSAVLLTMRSPMGGMSLSNQINRTETDATLAWPISRVVADLFDRVAPVHRLLQLVAYLVMAVAAGSILTAIYNTMNQRRREIAILRALGAGRRVVFGTIVAEAAAVALLGSLLGLVVHAVLMLVAAEVIRSRAGLVIQPLAFDPVLLYAPLWMTLVGALAGVVPAVKAYRTDVARHIVPTS